jgi:hypothetical protein
MHLHSISPLPPCASCLQSPLPASCWTQQQAQTWSLYFSCSCAAGDVLVLCGLLPLRPLCLRLDRFTGHYAPRRCRCRLHCKELHVQRRTCRWQPCAGIFAGLLLHSLTHTLEQILRAFYAAAEIQTPNRATPPPTAPSAPPPLLHLSNCNFSVEDHVAADRVRTTKFRSVCMTVNVKDMVVIFGRSVRATAATADDDAAAADSCPTANIAAYFFQKQQNSLLSSVSG